MRGGVDDADKQCEDYSLKDGSPWHDDGGATYDCEYYGARASRCPKNGHKYENEGKTANQACCVCGGGKEPGSEAVEKGVPKPDEGDNIVEEWCGGTLFKRKKHLQGDMILYWNIDEGAETITFGLLGPAGSVQNNRWISMGISADGGMAGSDAVAVWFDDWNQPHIEDLHFVNQSPSGVKQTPRQQIYDESVSKHNDRLALVYSRPWRVSITGAVELKPLNEFAPIIYAHGRVNDICAKSTVICNHKATDRWQTEVALTAPDGMSVYDLNKGGYDEPCHGPAQTECAIGFTCFHEFAGDQFANDYQIYGECKSEEYFNPDKDDGEDWSGVQNVFPNNNGGYEKKENLRGGFVLLYTISKSSPVNQYGPDDFISVAVISTLPSRQGWIGFGWSPNGEMKGTDVVIGWSEDENQFIGDYFLEGQVSSLNVPSGKQNIINERVIRKNNQLALQFDRPLTPADSVQFNQGDMHIIIGTGPTPDQDDIEYIPYHRYRAAMELTFLNLPAGHADWGSAAENELCAGTAGIRCKTGLECLKFPDEMFEVNWETAAQDMDGFTTNSDWGHGGKGGAANPFANITTLRGKGMCVTDGVATEFANIDMNALGKTQVIDPANFDDMFRLRWGFDVHWKFLGGGMIRIAVVGNLGPGYLGIGFGGGGRMIGSTSVIGWKGFDESSKETEIHEYYHADKLPWQVMPIPRRQEHSSYTLGVTNMEVVTNGPETAIIFDRPLLTPYGHGDITEGPIPIVVAVGNIPIAADDYIGYHRFRDAKSITFYDASKPPPM